MILCCRAGIDVCVIHSVLLILFSIDFVSKWKAGRFNKQRARAIQSLCYIRRNRYYLAKSIMGTLNIKHVDST